MKSNNYVVIFGWMCNELNLKGNELLIYALIYGVSQDGKSKFSAGRTYISETFNISLPTVDKALQTLVTQNLIIKESCKNQSETDKYYANISSKETLVPENISSKKTLHNNIVKSNTVNNQLNIIQDNTNITNKEDTYREKISNFVDDYNSICVSLPKCVRMTVKRNKGISNILKKFSYDDVLTVFDKLEASDFCTNRLGKGWKANIDFILKEENFVKTLEGRYDNQGRTCNVETISQGNKRHLTQEEKERIKKNGQKF